MPPIAPLLAAFFKLNRWSLVVGAAHVASVCCAFVSCTRARWMFCCCCCCCCCCCWLTVSFSLIWLQSVWRTRCCPCAENQILPVRHFTMRAPLSSVADSESFADTLRRTCLQHIVSMQWILVSVALHSLLYPLRRRSHSWLVSTRCSTVFERCLKAIVHRMLHLSTVQVTDESTPFFRSTLKVIGLSMQNTSKYVHVIKALDKTASWVWLDC